MRLRAWRLLAALTIALLAGCASTVPLPAAPPTTLT